MSKLRIAVWHNLPSGGGKRQLYNHVKGLLERGHYVESWCPDTADQKFLPLGELVKEHIVPLAYRGDEFRNPLRPYKATRKMIRSFEDHCKECALQINGGNFDVLYANACMYLRTTAIAKHVSLPTALYLGEPYRWFYEATPDLPWIAPRHELDRPWDISGLKEMIQRQFALSSIRLQARAEIEFARAFDLILSNSVYSRESILKTYDLDSRVCYLGVDTLHYKPTGEKKEDFVVGLGTIYRGKGVDRAIRAIGCIEPAKRPPLVWIGNNVSEMNFQEYKDLARQMNVEFVTKVHIPDEEVISLLSRARVMIYTSRLEPFGLAPLEANACSTPVVGVAEGGVKETIRDGLNGFLALNDDPQAMADLIVKILDDPKGAAEMGLAARRYVQENWHHDFGTDNIESALLSLAHRKGATRIARNRSLNDLMPTNDIRMNVEERELQGNTLRIKGWGAIDDGGGSQGASMFLLIQVGEKRRVVPMKTVKRYDVTNYFGGTVNFDDCGFFLECVITETDPNFGLVIVRGEKVSYRPF